MDYNKTFDTRISKYNYAINTYPEVLEMEFKTAVDICKIKETDILLNILAGGIPLQNYFITKPFLYKEYELNSKFNNNICLLDSLSRIPENDNTIDTIITLTSLHHIINPELSNYYKECHRILKNQNGKFIIGDVLENSKEAKWLNEFVDKYNSNGHKGHFFSQDHKSIIQSHGFTTEVEIKTYPWKFENEDTLIDFIKNLFGLDLATTDEIYDGINNYLNPKKINNIIYIDWTLIYFISTKHPNSFQHHHYKTDSLHSV